MSTMGLFVATPSAIVFTMPFSTLGMNWFGMDPPKILSTYSNPEPRGRGSTSMLAMAYWPWPPDCLTWRPSACTLVLMVSL